MERQAMLRRLGAIENPVVAFQVWHDEHYEFWILTKEKGIIGYITADWPLGRPLKFSADQAEAVRRLKSKGIDLAREGLKEYEGDDVANEVLEIIRDLGYAEVVTLAAAIEQNWPPEVDCYSFKIGANYDDYESDQVPLFPTSEEARSAAIAAMVADYGTRWSEMNDDELAWWCEQLANYRANSGE